MPSSFNPALTECVLEEDRNRAHWLRLASKNANNLRDAPKRKNLHRGCIILACAARPLFMLLRRPIRPQSDAFIHESITLLEYTYRLGKTRPAKHIDIAPNIIFALNNTTPKFYLVINLKRVCHSGRTVLPLERPYTGPVCIGHGRKRPSISRELNLPLASSQTWCFWPKIYIRTLGGGRKRFSIRFTKIDATSAK